MLSCILYFRCEPKMANLVNLLSIKSASITVQSLNQLNSKKSVKLSDGKYFVQDILNQKLYL